MRELKSSHTETFDIRSFENDARQRLKLTSLFQFLQEVAGRHVAGTPIGYEALKEQGRFWVLVRIKARIYSMPVWRDRIEVRTWAKKMDKMFAYREFEVYKEQEPLIAVSSEWMLMDRQTRKPCRLSTLSAEMPILNRESLPGALSKITPEGSAIKTVERQVRFSDIDMYDHVNNTTYIEWSLDCFDISFLKEKEVEEIQINFVAEAGADDEMAVTLYKADNDPQIQHFFIEGYNKTKQTKAYQLEVRLR